MGYASYLEDILERFEKDYDRVLHDTDLSFIDTRERLKVLKRAIGQLFHQIRRDMEYATDPQMDVLIELRQAQSENAKLETEIRKLKNRIEELKSQIEDMRLQHADDIEKLRDKMMSARKEWEKKEKKLVRLSRIR